MAPALVNDTAFGGGSTSATTSGAITIPSTSAGSIIVVAVGMGTAATPSTSVSSISGGGTWTKVANDNSSTRKDSSEIWWTAPSTGTTSVTVNFAATCGYGGHILEFSGCNTTNPFDAGGGTNGSSTAPSTPTVVATSPAEAMVAIVNQGTSTVTVSSPTSGWTADAQQINHPTSIAAMTNCAYRASTTGGSYSYGLTLSASAIWSACIATFRAAPVSGTPYLVQKASAAVTNVAAGATFSASFPQSTTAGNLLIAYAGDRNGAFIPTPPSGWSQAWSDADSTNSQSQILCYYPNNPGGITTVTFTSTDTAQTECDLIIGEFQYASAVDLAAPHSVNQTATTTPSLTSGVTTWPVELVIAGFMAESSGPTFTAGSGYTPVAVTADLFFLEWAAVSTVAAQTAGCTMSVSQVWGGGIATFKGPLLLPKSSAVLQAINRAAGW